MTYRIERRLRRGSWVWAILKNGEFYGSTRSYVLAFKMVNLLNENASLTAAKIAKLDAVTRGESYRLPHLSNVRTALKARGMR